MKKNVGKEVMRKWLIMLAPILTVFATGLISVNFLNSYTFESAKKTYTTYDEITKACFSENSLEKRNKAIIDNFKPIFEENVTILNISYTEVEYNPKCDEKLLPIKLSAIVLELLNENQESISLMVKPTKNISKEDIKQDGLLILQKDKKGNYIANTVDGKKFVLLNSDTSINRKEDAIE